MRRITVLSSCCLAVALVAVRLAAEQEVTLKTGATLIGDVTLDGDAVVVKIDDGEMRVPLKDVGSVTAVDSGHQMQASRLLLTALEAKLLSDSGKEVVGILAEAARIAPDDARIAFWYASALADAGFGKAANEVFEPKRAEIEKLFPGMADRLSARIEQRLNYEKLPAELVERIDALAKVAGNQSIDAESRRYFAVFRVVDQHGKPVDQTSLNIQASGNDEDLETFSDGYFTFVFTRNRHSSNDPCRIEIAQYGLRPAKFEFRPASNRVPLVGDFKVHRFDEASKRPIRVLVVDKKGDPVADATVSLQPASRTRGTLPAEEMTLKTGKDGRGEFRAYPMTYFYLQTNAAGFKSESTTAEMKEGADASEHRIELYRALNATVRVAWASTTAAPGQGKTTGEATLQLGAGPGAYQYDHEMPNWIRLMQVKDGVTLQFMQQQYGPMPQGANWLREDSVEAEGDPQAQRAAALEKFAAIDLNKFDELKDKLKPIDVPQPPNYRGPAMVKAELGKIYIGKMAYRDPQTGQPVEMSFKAVVEDLSEPAEE